MGSPLIPYKTDENSKSNSEIANNKPLTSKPAHDKKDLRGYGDILYVGGHKMYPKGGETMIFLYDDCFELGAKREKTVLSIPYSDIISLDNMDETKISAERVAVLGVLGALLKKRHVYTVIRYKEEWDDQTIVLDFENNIDKLQPYIYKKMLDIKKNKSSVS
jgi:hypothetical protein